MAGILVSHAIWRHMIVLALSRRIYLGKIWACTERGVIGPTRPFYISIYKRPGPYIMVTVDESHVQLAMHLLYYIMSVEGIYLVSV